MRGWRQLINNNQKIFRCYILYDTPNHRASDGLEYSGGEEIYGQSSQRHTVLRACGGAGGRRGWWKLGGYKALING